MDDFKDFEARNRRLIDEMHQDSEFQALHQAWLEASHRYEYCYHFSWLGFPMIQYPQDIVAVQEVIWRVQPDLIVETGIARGGSLIFSASLLEIKGGDGLVVGIDVDLRPHNRQKIMSHRLAQRIRLIDGSSTDPDVIEQVYRYAQDKKKVLVLLDSMHTHDHVLKELRSYEALVRADSYLIVFDTLIERMPPNAYPNRPWCVGNNPYTAVKAFLSENHRFVIDGSIDKKLGVSATGSGYLKALF